MKSRLAGMTALCTANPFPEITLGDGINNQETRRMKWWYDRDKAFAGDLNPKFFLMREVDAVFPEDWKLEVAIHDKGMM